VTVVTAVFAATLVLAVDRPADAQPTTWNFAQANVLAAQAPGHSGAGITVAIVDTWVDLTHPNFGGRVQDEAYCVGQNGSCRDHQYAPDPCVHGTHVAGTVASATYGVAPAARILAVQVLSYDPTSGECSGSTSDVAAGISWATAHGAGVINMSLGDLVPGLFQSTAVTSAVHAAAAAGVVVVIAAGNSSLPLTDNYGTDALLVAATGPSGQLATYSDRNGSVALAAPGGDDGADGLNACRPSDCILSTEPHDQYGLLEGTSMAAPHVSGTAALLLSQDPGRGRADVFHALEASSRPLAGAGYGVLNARAALSLRAASASSPSAPSPAPGSNGTPRPAAPVGGTASQARLGIPASKRMSPASTVRRPATRDLSTHRPPASSTATRAVAPLSRTPAAASAHHSGPLLWLGLLGAGLLVAGSAAVARRLLHRH
jgi:subtilisin family serine protease